MSVFPVINLLNLLSQIKDLTPLISDDPYPNEIQIENEQILIYIRSHNSY